MHAYSPPAPLPTVYSYHTPAATTTIVLLHLGSSHKQKAKSKVDCHKQKQRQYYNPVRVVVVVCMLKPFSLVEHARTHQRTHAIRATRSQEVRTGSWSNWLIGGGGGGAVPHEHSWVSLQNCPSRQSPSCQQRELPQSPPLRSIAQ